MSSSEWRAIHAGREHVLLSGGGLTNRELEGKDHYRIVLWLARGGLAMRLKVPSVTLANAKVDKGAIELFAAHCKLLFESFAA